MLSNTFVGNNGWKRSNGGAITIRGRILSSVRSGSEDFPYMLKATSPTDLGSEIMEEELKTLDSVEGTILDLFIKDCLFEENLGGYKGSALYINNIQRVYMKNTTFTKNKPMMWGLRNLNSYYSRYILPTVEEKSNISNYEYYCCGFNMQELDILNALDTEGKPIKYLY